MNAELTHCMTLLRQLRDNASPPRTHFHIIKKLKFLALLLLSLYYISLVHLHHPTPRGS